MGSGCGSDGSPVASDKTGEIQIQFWRIFKYNNCYRKELYGCDQVVTACLTFSLTIWVQIPLTSTLLLYIVAQKNENKQKGARVVQFKKINYVRLQSKTLAV